MDIFDPDFWLDCKSDFTIHSLRRYRKKLKEGKCLLVNDGTTLFASKSQRGKDRLVGGLSELLADEKYTYQDFGTKFSLEGKITMAMNMTSEAYLNYKDRLLGLTFGERLLALHHTLTKPEKDEWVEKEEKSRKMRFEELITVDDIETDVVIRKKYFNVIRHLAQEFSYLSLKTFIGCQDLIKGTLKAHASMNDRDHICRDDIEFVEMVKEYLVNPFSPYEGRIVKYRAQGFSYRDICKKLGKSGSYLGQVQRVVKKAELRGILDVKEVVIKHNRRRIRK